MPNPTETNNTAEYKCFKFVCDYLSDPKEDIYTLEDDEDICQT